MTKSSTGLSPNKQALLRIRELKQQLADAQSRTSDPIAIVSMACRFPRRAATPELFWESLVKKTDEVSEIPDTRWELEAFHDEDPDVPGKMYARHGVFLENIDLMDPEFFGISPREATWVDPQQRLLMEVGWEALERAGWTPAAIGEQTGVFVGWMHNDYQNEASDSFLNLNPYIATGAAGSFLCGRLAYYLGLQGPSVAVDTACSSSLVALHLAIQSLQRHDCDRALVGGVNAICSPTTNILTCKLKALSPKGHSRAFDAAADGYLRGEGCGVVTLRRLADAQEANDPILGIIRGSAVGHNGFSSGLTAPNPKAQEKVIRQALVQARIDPEQVAYLEAHGTGTDLGDPIEMRAAAAALSGKRDAQNPLLVGSVKTNIGHLEAAAGMAGLIKVLLAMQNDIIPGQMNFDEPNPHIPWSELPVEILTDLTPWPDIDRKIAGVSAFGMSGTNAHVVIEAPRSSSVQPKSKIRKSGHHIITLSAKHEEAIYDLAEAYRRSLSEDDSVDLAAVSQTSTIGRSHFEHRAALIAESSEELKVLLGHLARGTTDENAIYQHHRRAPRVAWQFTGQGSQYLGMGRELYETFPVFQKSIDACEAELQRQRQQSLLRVMWEDADTLVDTTWAQPAIFAIQMGLASVLEWLGMRPAAVFGHSVGQYAAACVAGVMTWQDGIRLISERGRLIGGLPTGGCMLAVFAPLHDVESELRDHDALSLAASNGTHNVVSGPSEEINAIVEQLAERGIRSKKLETSHAFHSVLMEPILDLFAEVADRVVFQSPKIPLFCNSDGNLIPAEACLEGRYWADHIRQPVRYHETVKAVQEFGCDAILELGPQPVLTRMAAAGWVGSTDGLIQSLQRDQPDSRSLLQMIGRLYVQGATPDFGQLVGKTPNRAVPLPTYPFQRRRFWGPDKPRAFHAEFHTAHPLLGSEVALAGVEGERRFEGYVEPDSPAWLPDHEVMGQVMMPGAAWVEMSIAATEGRVLSDLIFEQPLQPKTRVTMQTVTRKVKGGEDSLEIFSSSDHQRQWTRHLTGKIGNPVGAATSVDREALEARLPESVDPLEFYQTMDKLGLNYGPEFQTIQSIRHTDKESLTHLKTESDVRGFHISPPLLDGAFHGLAIGLQQGGEEHLFLPVGIEQLEFHRPVQNEVWCHAIWHEADGQSRTADLVLFDDAGQVVASIRNFRVHQVSLASLRQLSGAGAERLLFQYQWQSLRLPPSEIKNARWLIVSDQQQDTEAANAIASQLRERGHLATQVHLKAEGVAELADPVTISGQQAESWQACWDHLAVADSEESAAIDGILWLLPDHPLDLAETGESSCQSILNAVQTLLKSGKRQLRCGIQWVTRYGIASSEGEAVNPLQTQYWGLGRVLAAEQPELRCRLLDVATAELPTQEIIDVMLSETRDHQILFRDGHFLVPRIEKIKPSSRRSDSFLAREDRSYLVTGGLGKLGRHAARWLLDKGAGQLVLVSRRVPDECTQAWIESLGGNVVIHPADMTSPTDVKKLFELFGKDWKPLGGVIHAAGVLDDALIESQSWDRFRSVLAPKITAASLLHEQTRELELDLFVLYSSAASVLGSPGQSNYATGNAFMDGLAWHRREVGLPAVSINWGPWTEGMADDERIIRRLSMQGITPLAVDEAHAALEMILGSETVQATVMDVDWRRMRTGPRGETPIILENLVQSKQRLKQHDSALVSKLKQLKEGSRRELLINTIQGSLQGILSTSDVPETDRPLIEMGLDSLMAVEFGTELQQMLGDQFAVGPTMLFDHPTIDAITDYVLELLEDSATEPTETSETAPESATSIAPAVREDVAIIGMSCRFPGAESVDEFWANLLDGVDAVGEIPIDRWDIERFYSPDQAPGKMYTREGGFLSDIGDFDADFFNISKQEACWVDPQHRMLLEHSYLAMESAGIPSQPLSDSNVGVFMGIMGQDYAFLPTLDDEQVIHGFQGAGLSHSAGVGRISYIFGFEGPSVAVDTASSSSLVALLQATRSLQEGDCNMALAGGVNAILAPVNSLLMSKAGLLSPDGRCKSFSAAADGFGRGEGCGVVILKRLSDAQRDGDNILAVIRGGAVVHNGFTGGITSPSGKAQSRVIEMAVKDAHIAPSQVQYLEAHGTGTEYGDPMELGAATAIYAKGRPADKPLLVGSVKANISHLEAAGGISGLIKTVLAIQHGILPRQIHLDEPSPHIPWQRMPVKLLQENTPWPDVDQRIAGITALGLVGTNAHVILSSPPLSDQAADMPVQVRKNHLLVLSARNPDALNDLAKLYASFLKASKSDDLENICFTAANGRRHYEYRLALPVTDRDDAVDQLQKLQAFGVAEVSSRGNEPRLGWIFPSIENSGKDARFVLAQLVATEPVVAEMLADIDKHLAQYLAQRNQTAFSVLDSLTAEESSGSLLYGFLLQAALAKLWSTWGIEPDAVVGFGTGELAAYCVAGGMCFKDAAILVFEQQQLGENPDHDALDAFEKFADDFNFYPPKMPLVSGHIGGEVPVYRSLGGGFWREMILSDAGSTDEAISAFIQLGCDSVLQFTSCQEASALSFEQYGINDWRSLPPSIDASVGMHLMKMLGELYKRGWNPEFQGLYPATGRRRVKLPSYPFQKQRYWITEISKFMQSEEKLEQPSIS